MEFAVGRALADGEFFRDRRWSRGSQLGDEQEDLLLSGCRFGPAGVLQHLRGGLGTFGADGERGVRPGSAPGNSPHAGCTRGHRRLDGRDS